MWGVGHIPTDIGDGDPYDRAEEVQRHISDVLRATGGHRTRREVHGQGHEAVCLTEESTRLDGSNPCSLIDRANTHHTSDSHITICEVDRRRRSFELTFVALRTFVVATDRHRGRDHFDLGALLEDEVDLLRVVFGPRQLDTSVLAISGLRLDGENTSVLLRKALHIEGEDDGRTLIDALLSTASQIVVGLALTGAEAKCGGEEQCSERISKDFLHRQMD